MASASSHAQPPTTAHHNTITPGHGSPAKKLSLEPAILLPSAQPDAAMSDTAPKDKKPQQGGRSSQVKTPEPRASKERINGHRDASDRSPSTPGHLVPFDWEEFQARYEDALADADREEQELLKEFEDLVKFFNVWASAASVNDSERGVKRLQTRERHVRLAEQSLSQKKKHLAEVVRAFQSALALLEQTTLPRHLLFPTIPTIRHRALLDLIPHIKPPALRTVKRQKHHTPPPWRIPGNISNISNNSTSAGGRGPTYLSPLTSHMSRPLHPQRPPAQVQRSTQSHSCGFGGPLASSSTGLPKHHSPPNIIADPRDPTNSLQIPSRPNDAAPPPINPPTAPDQLLEKRASFFDNATKKTTSSIFLQAPSPADPHRIVSSTSAPSCETLPAHHNASATPNMASASSIKVPQITPADMLAFHEAHFSTLATHDFQAHFLRPSDHPPVHEIAAQPVPEEEEYYQEEEEEDDGLGYYPDGVKRTLTDEQIAIFRHSEIEALRRARESPSQSRNTHHRANPSPQEEDAAQSASEDGEVSSPLAISAPAKKSKKRKRGKQHNRLRPGDEGFVDLRKRTWDVVDKGLETLDYGEEENTDPADDGSKIQRRCISLAPAGRSVGQPLWNAPGTFRSLLRVTTCLSSMPHRHLCRKRESRNSIHPPRSANHIKHEKSVLRIAKPAPTESNQPNPTQPTEGRRDEMR
ncbi:hypothetical protein VTJ83DRAFT_2197 [Remersonia thermophila]|uniref:Uncharacterized protein n=1 Tax=Remersonia thermophila TaxID=72144 RepID=A0ABR4DI16_9PEZI